MIFRILLLALLTSIPTVQVKKQPQQPKMKFQATYFKMGTYSASERPVRKMVYVFTNEGKEPLLITEVKIGCPCTKVRYTKHPVQHGEKGYVDVFYDSKYFPPGHVNKSIGIRSNGLKPYDFAYLTFEGDTTK